MSSSSGDSPWLSHSPQESYGSSRRICGTGTGLRARGALRQIWEDAVGPSTRNKHAFLLLIEMTSTRHPHSFWGSG